MDLKIITTKEENRTDSIFYYDEEIAIIQLSNGNKLLLESRGELQILTEDTKFKGKNALDWLYDNNYNDNTINKLYDNDSIAMNNWFAITEVDVNGETISDDLAISQSYDEAINDLKAVYNDLNSKNCS